MPPTFGYTHVVEVKNARSFYISDGQLALDNKGQIVGKGNLAIQTKQVFENINHSLEAAGVCFNDVVKLTFFLTDISNMKVVREIRDQYVNKLKPPASSAAEDQKLISEGFLIEIEAIAVGD